MLLDFEISQPSSIFFLFAASYQAFCEFIDNSIQATSINNTKDMERTIDVHIFLKDVSDKFLNLSGDELQLSSGGLHLFPSGNRAVAAFG